jgi:hypothetical protein
MSRKIAHVRANVEARVPVTVTLTRLVGFLRRMAG